MSEQLIRSLAGRHRWQSSRRRHERHDGVRDSRSRPGSTHRRQWLGKSTFAARHFGEFETLSSDTFRGWVSDDPNSQESTSDAFEVLEFVAAKRLRRGRLTVVDATNVQPAARKRLVALAREHDILPVAVVLDIPESVCSARNDARSDRTFGRDVIRRQHQQLTRSLRGLGKEGFRSVHILRGEDAVSEATFLRHPLRSDLRVERGPFDVIGDIHGCRSELETLLVKLGYTVDYGTDGRAVDAVPPEGRTAVFLGDYVDRGPDSVVCCVWSWGWSRRDTR